MTSTLTLQVPIEGPRYDKQRPETRQPWLDFRRPGLTATQIRDWGTASKRRQIIEEKVTGNFEDLSHLPYVNHGNIREPAISAWIESKFGITPCESTYAHPENSRHLASPDGISRDPFTGELYVGVPQAVLAEIKTSKHDLHPGTIDEARVLVDIVPGSHFDRSNYYTQMQWQMYVMNADRTLFVWEQHDDKIDPESGTFTPIGPPQFVWVPRNQDLIDALVEKVAPRALAEIDRALALRTDELPPVSDFPTEHAVWVQEVLKARDAAAAAEAAREKSWDALAAVYLHPEAPDCKHDLGFATLSVSSSEGRTTSTNESYLDIDGMNAREKQQYERAQALIEKHTKVRKVVKAGKFSRRMTITPKEVKP
jgi:hypothetical protein